MKHITAIFLVLVVLIGALAVSASASDLDFSPVEYGFVTEYKLHYEDTQLHASGIYLGTENFDMTKNVGDTKPTYTYISADSDSRDFELWLTTPIWEGYDFIDVQLQFRVSHITSISATLGDVNIPIEYGYISDSAFDGQSFYLTVRMDLRGLESTSADPVLKVCGMISWEYTSLVALTACSGVTIIQDPELNFFESILAAIADFRNSIGSWLEGLFEKYFGSGDSGTSAGASASQTQQEVMIESNQFVSNAVTDWNLHSESLQTSSDLAMGHATVGLLFLSNWAVKVFDNMGWFGSVYLMVGLVSAIMLLLSKSGIAYRIASADRRNSGDK